MCFNPGEKKRERGREREERKRGENGMEGEQGKWRGGEKERGKGRNGGKAEEGSRKNIVLKRLTCLMKLSPHRSLYLPTVGHLLIVNKLLSLSLSLSLSLCLAYQLSVEDLNGVLFHHVSLGAAARP